MDASEWGLGATRASASLELAAETGRIRERWRWNAADTTSANPRAAAALRDARVVLGAAVERAEAIVEDYLQYGTSAGPPPARRQDVPCRVRMPDPLHSRQSLSKFPDVSADLMDAHWYVVGSRPWRNKKEHIVTLEGRAIVYGVEQNVVAHGIIVDACCS